MSTSAASLEISEVIEHLVDFLVLRIYVTIAHLGRRNPICVLDFSLLLHLILSS